MNPLHSAPPSRHHPSNATVLSATAVHYAQQQVGARIHEDRKRAYQACKRTVERIAAQCRKKNRRFRDIEFDIENDKHNCLHNLTDSVTFLPSDVERVTDLFAKPTFFTEQSTPSEVIQGAVENCYFVSALSAMSTMPDLVHQLCVARDEEVGVYGFIFHRDCYWISVVVDDLLFTRVPKYEQLTRDEKEIYHFDKERYNQTARKSVDALYFSKAGVSGDTWIPLAEKAYAKAHGDYGSVMYGRTCDALEDMTGGVSSLILCKDILNVDEFWTDELLKCNKDRLFGCWFKSLDGGRNTVKNVTVGGLVGNLSHSIVRAVECKGRRFVVLRGPWGEPEWDGPWSNGSKEWTPEWLEILPELGHDFTKNGQFVMEYKDFLSTWQEIQRTLFFDDSWFISSQWLHLSPKTSLAPWSYGNISFSFSLPSRAPTILVVTRADNRYFRDLQGSHIWNIDFTLVREGHLEPITDSCYSFFYTRNVSLEIDLEPGDYTVHVRLDAASIRDKDYVRAGLNAGWDRRKFSRVSAERAKTFSIASNYKPSKSHVVKTLSEVLTEDAMQLDKAAINAIKTYSGEIGSGSSITLTTTTTTQTMMSKQYASQATPKSRHRSPPPQLNGYNEYNHPRFVNPGHGARGRQSPNSPFRAHTEGEMYQRDSHPAQRRMSSRNDRARGNSRPGSPIGRDGPSSPHPSRPSSPPLPPPPPPFPRAYSPLPLLPQPLPVLEDYDALVIGLKVYTQNTVPTTIAGRVRSQEDERGTVQG
ncbi:hypothetical protein BKA70DRAFT_1502774 [Coprinopsis sp. MPI-PUGE-AT-0042]|nr:hypothetical protein BKA70DRAFT_1502774 [Coprinopsis sp. MPI-PUGE-AT-0042]